MYCRRKTARSPRPTRSARASTIPGSDPSCRTCATRDASPFSRRPTRKRCMRSRRSLAARGSSVRSMASGLRLRAPLVAMGYMNPVESMGSRAFARALREAGLCGAIVPDLPLEEAQPVRDDLAAEGLDLVPLVAPTTPKERAARIARTARGFVYYVSVTGVTGARAALPDDLEARLAELRAVSSVPVAVGFGISRPEQAAALKGKADGVVVGSAVVALHHERGVDAVAGLVRSLRSAL